MIIEPRRNIVIGPLLQVAIARCWAARDHLLRLGVLPAVALVLIIMPFAQIVDAFRMSAISGTDDPALVFKGMLLVLGYGLVMAIFSVNWLRQLTLGPDSVPGLGLTLAPRHFRFFLALLGIGVAAMVPVMMLYPIFMVLLQSMPGMLAGAAMAFLIWAALLARLSPSWIGIAIDAPMPLMTAWRRTAGQGYKLVIAMLAVEVGVMLAQQVIAVLFELTGLGVAAPATYVLATATADLIGVALQLSVLVTAFPYFLSETV